jgi:hypothetical protein
MMPNAISTIIPMMKSLFHPRTKVKKALDRKEYLYRLHIERKAMQITTTIHNIEVSATCYPINGSHPLGWRVAWKTPCGRMGDSFRVNNVMVMTRDELIAEITPSVCDQHGICEDCGDNLNDDGQCHNCALAHAEYLRDCAKENF